MVFLPPFLGLQTYICVALKRTVYVCTYGRNWTENDKQTYEINIETKFKNSKGNRKLKSIRSNDIFLCAIFFHCRISILISSGPQGHGNENTNNNHTGNAKKLL